MDLSKLLHGFVNVATYLLKLLRGFVKVGLCISRPLPNKTKLKFDLAKDVD